MRLPVTVVLGVLALAGCGSSARPADRRARRREAGARGRRVAAAPSRAAPATGGDAAEPHDRRDRRRAHRRRVPGAAPGPRQRDRGELQVRCLPQPAPQSIVTPEPATPPAAGGKHERRTTRATAAGTGSTGTGSTGSTTTDERRDPRGARYRIERLLGSGGMAVVYLRATTRSSTGTVAVKLLAENLAGDDEFRGRFLREARLAARLSHPNVVARLRRRRGRRAGRTSSWSSSRARRSPTVLAAPRPARAGRGRRPRRARRPPASSTRTAPGSSTAT